MNEFRNALGRFRDALHQAGERSEIPELQALLERDRGAKARRPRWTMVAWAAAAVVFMLAAIPVYQKQREAEQAKADTLLLQQVNAGLSRSVPRAMAPLMGWAPGN